MSRTGAGVGRRPGDRRHFAVSLLVVAAIALFCLGPLFWIGLTSLKAPGTEFRTPVEYFPDEPTLESYAKVTSESFSVQTAIRNSLIVSTGAMVGLGKTFSNMMVDLRATNDKLRDRAGRIIAEICGIPRGEALGLLDGAGNSVKHAIVMHKLGIERDRADELLRDAGGHLSRVLGEQR